MQERATYQLPVGTMKKRRRGVVRTRHRHHHLIEEHVVEHAGDLGRDRLDHRDVLRGERVHPAVEHLDHPEQPAIVVIWSCTVTMRPYNRRCTQAALGKKKVGICGTIAN